MKSGRYCAHSGTSRARRREPLPPTFDAKMERYTQRPAYVTATRAVLSALRSAKVMGIPMELARSIFRSDLDVLVEEAYTPHGRCVPSDASPRKAASNQENSESE